MALRLPEKQSLHDNVIAEVIKELDSTEYDIYQNPGSYKNAGIKGNYPDIIMTEKGRTTVKFIIEVETEDSINVNEAVNQWKKYATEIDATFYLLVPESYKNVAINLCKQIGISVRFATFSTDIFKRVIQFSFE